MSKSVYAIILSYNGRDLTLDCLRSCLKQTHSDLHIIVVDNASSDDSIVAIQKEFQREITDSILTLIVNTENKGFAGGNNVGMEYAMRRGADLIFLINNDTVLDPNCVEELIGASESDNAIGILGPKIYFFQPKDQIWFAGADLKMYRGVSRHRGIREIDSGQYDISSESDYISGCGMLIKREVIEKVGYLDTDFRMYAEDADYSLRARYKGYKLFYVPKAKMWHKVSASVGGQLKFKKLRLRLQSQFKLFYRHASWYHFFTIPIFMISDVFRILILVIMGKIRN